MDSRSTDREPVVVVSGASRGIGRAIARRFAREGFRVVALDRTAPDDSTASEDARIEDVRVDVTDRVALEGVRDAIERESGPVFALINNAGVFGRTPALDFDAQVVRRILETNLEAALTCVAVFGARMAERRRGRIVNVASIAAHAGAALASAYAASKAGLVAATQSHARELAPLGIAVNAVLPGYCDTPMMATERALITGFVVPRIPLRRVAEPDEIAEVVERLVSLRTPYLTGAAIPVDGGLHVG